MTEMVKRFQMSRWSAIRRRIHDMSVGDEFKITKGEWADAHTSCVRLTEAYERKRIWVCEKVGNKITARRMQ